MVREKRFLEGDFEGSLVMRSNNHQLQWIGLTNCEDETSDIKCFPSCFPLVSLVPYSFRNIESVLSGLPISMIPSIGREIYKMMALTLERPKRKIFKFKTNL